MKKRAQKDIVDIDAIIYTEKESHKGIIIGKKGTMLKEIGIRARRDIEHLLGDQINLQLWVKVKKDWRDNDILLKNFGYDINWCERAEADVKEIIICDNIFDIDDLSGEKIYIDINDCILRTEDDMLDVINYNYSKRSFAFANKPVFMQKIKELRAKME